MKNKRLVLVLSGITIAVILLAAFSSLRRNEVPIRAEQAAIGNIASTIATNGKIEPINNFEAHAPMSTTVKRVLVQQGERVRPGQLLLELEDSEARAQAAKALAQLRAAEADLKAVQGGGTHEEVITTETQLVKARGELQTAQRNIDALVHLQQQNAASAAEVAQAQNQLKAVQAEVSLLEQKQSSRYSNPEVARVAAQHQEARTAYAAAQDALHNLNVRAPREGIVYSLPVRAGSYVSGGELLVQVANLSTMRLRAFVDEPEIGRLAPGEKVTVSWDALPERTWLGTLTAIPTTVVMKGTRSVGEITSEIPNPDLRLLPNINVNVVITTAQHTNVLTVAREAIRQDDGQRYVYQVVNGTLHKQDVDTSISNPTRIEITKGLAENALVALMSTNGRPLRDGLPVRVVQ